MMSVYMYRGLAPAIIASINLNLAILFFIFPSGLAESDCFTCFISVYNYQLSVLYSLVN